MIELLEQRVKYLNKELDTWRSYGGPRMSGEKELEIRLSEASMLLQSARYLKKLGVESE